MNSEKASMINKSSKKDFIRRQDRKQNNNNHNKKKLELKNTYELFFLGIFLHFFIRSTSPFCPGSPEAVGNRLQYACLKLGTYPE